MSLFYGIENFFIGWYSEQVLIIHAEDPLSEQIFEVLREAKLSGRVNLMESGLKTCSECWWAQLSTDYFDYLGDRCCSLFFSWWMIYEKI